MVRRELTNDPQPGLVADDRDSGDADGARTVDLVEPHQDADDELGEAPETSASGLFEEDDLVGGTSDRTMAAAPRARRRSVAPPAIHTLPTQSVRRGVLAPSERLQTVEPTHQSTATTPLDALRLEEIARTQMFLRLVFVILMASIGAVMVAKGHPIARAVMLGGVFLVGSASAWLYWAIRTPEGYTTSRVTVAAYLITIGAFAGVYYWGVFSPSSGLVVLGLYFFSFGASFQSTLSIYLTCAAVQAILSALILSGAIPDLGVMNADSLEFIDRLMLQGIIQFFYLFAFIIARKSRQTTLDAVSRLEAAVRAVSQREAMLFEARQDLDRALRIGGPGRYTGQRIGEFSLGNLIGHGGMGEVYDAVRESDQRQAAVKLLHARVLADPGHRERFLRETRIAQSIRSRHVVEVLDVGATEGELPFLAMERLHGSDLAEQLRRRRRLAPVDVTKLIDQAAEGLRAAHALGIVHRDIKPHNLFLAESGKDAMWKVLDFGVSKAADQSGTLTQGHVVGTPAYMAPEQARGEDVDLRADVYALAAITYRALTGQPPFRNKDLPTTLYDVVYRMPPQPSKVIDLPETVDLLLAIGLAKRAADRFATGDEFAAALRAALQGEIAPELRRHAAELLVEHAWGATS